MKMKLIILLLVIFNTAIQFCPGGQDFHTISERLSIFKGNMNFLKKYDKGVFKKFSFEGKKSFDIVDIKDGLIIKDKPSVDTVDEKFYTYLTHNNVVCHTNSKSAKKECLLQFLSITFNVIYYREINFSYTPVIDDQKVEDCEQHLRDQLNQGLTCRIEYIEMENQVFIIPLSEEIGDEINFHTETNEFYGPKSPRFKANTSHFEVTDDSATLKLGIRHVKFPKTNSCYYLLFKISTMLPRECPIDTFDYLFLDVYPGSKMKPVYDLGIPPNGKLIIRSRDDIEFTNGSFTKQINFNHVRQAGVFKGFLPVYDKVLWVIIQNKDYRYKFFVYYWTKECKKYIKSLLKLENKTCPRNENALYYYSIDTKGEKLKQGKLEFNDYNILSVKNHNKLVPVRKIMVSNMELVTNPLSGEELIISGSLVEKEVKETYILDLSSDNICSKRFNKIMDKFSGKGDSKNNVSFERKQNAGIVITQGKRNSKSFILRGESSEEYDSVLKNPLYDDEDN
jgi:hypothetical protein